MLNGLSLLSDALSDFLMDKRVAGLSDKTVRNYMDTVMIFIRHAGVGTCLDSVTYGLVSGYILDLYGRPLSRSSVSSYIRNLRIFLRWLYCRGLLSWDPVAVAVPKSPKKVVHVYSDDEIRTIFTSIHSMLPWMTARNCAMVSLMLDSGIRQCEVCRLSWPCVDFAGHLLHVVGKGQKERVVPLGNAAGDFLRCYRGLLPYPQSERVFVDRDGRPLSGNAIRLFTYRLQKRLPFKLSSHKLRHNFATNYCLDQLQATGRTDVYDLSILMGHESIETTKRYEHFAHELIAARQNISHLDKVFEIKNAVT